MTLQRNVTFERDVVVIGGCRHVGLPLADRRADVAVCEIDVACCPEGIAEGQAMTELPGLPQITSARHDRVLERAAALFGRLIASQVRMTPEEGELARPFTNAWRYIKFATANQLYMIANDRGLDFERISQGLMLDYPRASMTVGSSLPPLEVVVAKSDLLIIAASHPEYADLVPVKPAADIWNIRGGVRV